MNTLLQANRFKRVSRRPRPVHGLGFPALALLSASLLHATGGPALDILAVTAALSNHVAQSAGIVVHGACTRTFQHPVRSGAGSETTNAATVTLQLRFEATCYDWGYASRGTLVSSTGLSAHLLVPVETVCVRSNSLCLDLTTAPQAAAGDTNTAARGREARLSADGQQPGFPSYPLLPHAVLSALAMLDMPAARVIMLEPQGPASPAIATIRVEGRPRYDPEERWEIDFASNAGMLPVETRFLSSEGTVTMRTTATPSAGSNHWFPQEVLIEAFKDGRVTWREHYTDIKTQRTSDGIPGYATIPPGTQVEDHRPPVPVTYTMGNRPPTAAEVLAMQGNLDAVREYMRVSSLAPPRHRAVRAGALALLLVLVIGAPLVLRWIRRPPAAS